MLHLQKQRFTRHQAMIKRIFDVVVGSVAFVVSLPVQAVVALAVLVSSGRPIFFRQERIGAGGEPFTIVKFRTMTVDAEEELEALLSANDADGPLFKLRDDPRSTPIGRRLRTSGLDELPQLWNVLKGEMSLVGPRPALPRETAEFSDEAARPAAGEARPHRPVAGEAHARAHLRGVRALRRVLRRELVAHLRPLRHRQDHPRAPPPPRRVLTTCRHARFKTVTGVARVRRAGRFDRVLGRHIGDLCDGGYSVIGFIVGTGRCGSTLVHEILCRHPDIGFVSNVEDRVGPARFTDRWNGPLYRRLPPSWTEKGRLRFAPSEAYRALAREVSTLLVEPRRDLVAGDAAPPLGDDLRVFFERRASAQRAPVFSHKFTGWPRAGLLDAVFPDARFVHVVRDGRAVAASWLEMPWWRGDQGPDGWHFGPLPATYAAEWEASGRDRAVLAGLAWKLLLDAFATARASIAQERWLEIRYEDLVADPRSVMDHVLDHHGLAWTRASIGRSPATGSTRPPPTASAPRSSPPNSPW